MIITGIIPSPTPTPVPGEITAAFSADRRSGSAPIQVSFVDQSTGNPTSWVWNLGDGNTSTTRNVTHLYTTQGTYSVGLIVQNSASSGSIEKNGYITVT
nr:PKD domain-containing protein [uncultured Methanospirillum sp.]